MKEAARTDGECKGNTTLKTKKQYINTIMTSFIIEWLQ